MSLTGWPSNSTITSLRCRPALAAGEPSITLWITTPCVLEARPKPSAISGVRSARFTPSMARLTLPCATSCSATWLARLIGIAKPMPWPLGVDRGVDADGLAADVAQRAARVAEVDRRVGLDEVLEVRRAAEDVEVRCGPAALMMPTVTEPRSSPSGLPIAIAQSPTRSLSESPSGSVGRSLPSILITATSVSGIGADHLGLERALVVQRHGDVGGVRTT